MFNNLIESKPKKQRTTGGTIFSIVLHAVLITLAVEGTLQASQKFENLFYGELWNQHDRVDLFVKSKADEASDHHLVWADFEI